MVVLGWHGRSENLWIKKTDAKNTVKKGKKSVIAQVLKPSKRRIADTNVGKKFI